MTANVGYTPGTGAIVAADEIAGVLHQRIKIGVGVDGVAVDVSSANPMPVTLPDVTALNPLPVSDVTNAAAQQDMILLLTRMLNYLNAPQGYDKSQQRQRNTTVIESGTVTTVSTVNTVLAVGTVTNQTQMGGIQAQILVNAGNLAAWNAVVRSRIT
jgi:hypothetical protein